MDTLKATFNSVRLAERAREALLNLGLTETQLVLAQMPGQNSGDATPQPSPQPLPERVPDLLEPNSLPSRAYSPDQTLDPALAGGALLSPQDSPYNANGQESLLPDYNRHELDAGLYQLSVDLGRSSVSRTAVVETLEGAGGRIAG